MRKIVNAKVLLPDPELADNTQGFAGPDRQRNLVDGADDPRALRRDVMGREVLQLEQRAFGR